FLRRNAILAVIFVTDEDDCSADPESDLFDPTPTGVMKYGLLHSFRCTRFGVACAGSLVEERDSGGPLAGCSPATTAVGGKLIEVEKYIRYFTNEAKVDPRDVILASIAGPAYPVVTTMTIPCGDTSAPSCAMLSSSCNATGAIGPVSW